MPKLDVNVVYGKLVSHWTHRQWQPAIGKTLRELGLRGKMDCGNIRDIAMEICENPDRFKEIIKLLEE